MDTRFLRALLWSTLVAMAAGARILMLPYPFSSHVAELTHIARHLVSRGHDVRMLLSPTLPDFKRWQVSDQLAPRVSQCVAEETLIDPSNNCFTAHLSGLPKHPALQGASLKVGHRTMQGANLVCCRSRACRSSRTTSSRRPSTPSSRTTSTNCGRSSCTSLWCVSLAKHKMQRYDVNVLSTPR